MGFDEHRPFLSLEQFRLHKISDYNEIYDQVIVWEKIHGSNICIVGEYNGESWVFKYGSRRRWVEKHENFNNLQKLFESHKQQFIDMFNDINSDNKVGTVIRVYGEVFGGKYGHETAPGAFKTQREVDYCPHNDFAFFCIIKNSDIVPVNDCINYIQKVELKTPPIIFRGKFSNFVSSFDVEKYTSRVPNNFYGLTYIDTPKGTEGVVIQTLNPDATGDECTILKWKQKWAVENPRFAQKSPKKIDTFPKLIESCVNMVNPARMDSYISKNTIDDITNPRMIGQHVKEIVADTMKDIVAEFPTTEYPSLNIKLINKLVTQKAFPMFKDYIKQLENSSLSDEKRIMILHQSISNLEAEANCLTQRLKNANNRLNLISRGFQPM